MTLTCSDVNDVNVNTSGYDVIKKDRGEKKSFRGRTIQGRYNYLGLGL